MNKENLEIAGEGADRRQGYRTEIEYTHGFYPFLNPDQLLLSCVLQGMRPPADVVATGSAGRKLAYCDLGSGLGLSVNVMAARDPHGQYFGVDYNPAQIENARSFAESAGIDNIEFIEDSFGNLGKRGVGRSLRTNGSSHHVHAFWRLRAEALDLPFIPVPKKRYSEFAHGICLLF